MACREPPPTWRLSVTSVLVERFLALFALALLVLVGLALRPPGPAARVLGGSPGSHSPC